MKLIALSLLAALAVSCSSYNPAVVRPATSAAASLAFYAAKPDQRVELAKDFTSIASAFNTFSAGSIPTPVQVTLALNTYLPNNPSRSIVASSAGSVYGLFYPQFKDKAPAIVHDTLTNIVLGGQDAAAPYLQ